MLEGHVQKYHIERINIAEKDDEKWQSYERFEEAFELSNEIIDLFEWWQIRKMRAIDAGVNDVNIRIEEDRMLIRLAKIRHRIWWGI